MEESRVTEVEEPLVMGKGELVQGQETGRQGKSQGKEWLIGGFKAKKRQVSKRS
jgi:hypothetical protein